MVVQRETGIDYDLELEKAVLAIESSSVRTVLIQLAEGLRPLATSIVDSLQKRFPNVSFVVWAGSCFGACDVPPVENFDLLIAFGHSAWPFWEKTSSLCEQKAFK